MSVQAEPGRGDLEMDLGQVMIGLLVELIVDPDQAVLAGGDRWAETLVVR